MAHTGCGALASHAIMRPVLIPAFLLLTLGSGCFTYRHMGHVEVAIAPTVTATASCISARGGSIADYLEGPAGKQSAVAFDGAVIGWAPALIEATELDGMTAYAGQSCIMSESPFCDHMMIVKRGDWRYMVFWQYQYPTVAALPAAPGDIVASQQRLFPVIATIDLDDRSEQALAVLSDKRASGSMVRMLGLLAGAGTLTAGAYTADREMIAAGKDIYASGHALADAMAEEEKPLVAAHPRLIPILTVLADAGGNAMICAARPRRP